MRWEVVPQSVQQTREPFTYTIPMTPEAAVSKVQHLQYQNRPLLSVYDEAYKIATDTMQKVMLGEAVIYSLVGIVIVMLLLYLNKRSR
jgi:hypothetical protein